MTILDARLDSHDVVETYRKTAKVYDLWAALTETRARARCLELANVQDGESILEVAVGTGLVFEELLRRNPNGHIEGIDLTDAMLDRARHKASRIGHRSYRLQEGDARALPFEDKRFDLVVNNYMFDLLPEAEHQHVAAELLRVLRPGGRLTLVNMTKPWRFPQGAYELLYRVNPRWMGGCRGVELKETLNEVGFVDLHHERLSQLAFPSEIVRAYRPE